MGRAYGTKLKTSPLSSQATSKAGKDRVTRLVPPLVNVGNDGEERKGLFQLPIRHLGSQAVPPLPWSKNGGLQLRFPLNNCSCDTLRR